MQVEQATGANFSETELESYVAGADELDLVNSGLEETMINSFHQIREVQKRNGDDLDLRTAAFVNSIDKIVVCYEELGIFP